MFTTRKTTSELDNDTETKIILHFFRYRQIAAGSPQWPQAFYPMKKINTVQPGEVVTARCYITFSQLLLFSYRSRCTYNSTGVNHETHIGGTAGDEMCNLYIMYFTGKFCTLFLCLSGALYVIVNIGQACTYLFFTHPNKTVSQLKL